MRFSRLDRAQLAAADAAVEWLWRRLGLHRGMVLRMALVGQFLTLGAAEWMVRGQVQPFTAVFGLIVFLLFQRNEARFAANPALHRVTVLLRRQTRAAALIRGCVWGIAIFSLAFRAHSAATPLEVASVIFFLAFMIGGDALPPVGPRKPRRTRPSTLSQAATIAPVRGF